MTSPGRWSLEEVNSLYELRSLYPHVQWGDITAWHNQRFPPSRKRSVNGIIGKWKLLSNNTRTWNVIDEVRGDFRNLSPMTYDTHANMMNVRALVFGFWKSRFSSKLT